nr:MAG TPA: hypothetical protein [Caudoviricetes sp.]
MIFSLKAGIVRACFFRSKTSLNLWIPTTRLLYPIILKC